MNDPDEKSPADEPDVPQPRSAEAHATDPGLPLDRAAAAGLRRGYEVWYRDDYLVQLVRRGVPDGPSLLLVIVALLVFVAAILLALRRRTWHVVSLSVSLEGDVITHQQRARRPPPL
jgi:hypothetical protein